MPSSNVARRWVINASPLILLSKIGRLDLIDAVATEVVSDEELERALADLAQRESAVDEGEVDEQSQANLRRWVESMRQAIQAKDGKPERP